MNIPFFNRLQLKKITVGVTDENGRRAHKVLQGLLEDLPEMLMSCVVDTNSGKVLAFYTTNSAYNPNQISLRHAKLLRTLEEAVATQPWVEGPLTDVSVILEDELHHLRPLNQGNWYCFVAVRLADANLGITKETMRRHSF